MRARAVVLALAAGACSNAPQPVNETAAAAIVNAAATPSPAAQQLATGPLDAWLVGTWSFEQGCATDLVVRYEAGGVLQNSGDTGRWALDGDTVTETVTERFEMGGDAPVKLDPPEVRRYTIARADANHGTITFEGRKVPILRC